MVSRDRNGRMSSIQMTIKTNFGSIVIPCLFLLCISNIGNYSQAENLPANDVCTKCDCRKGIGGYSGNQLEISIDCSQRELDSLPVDWPFNITEGEDMEDARLVVTFSGNALGTLRKIPPTHAKNVSLSFRYCGLSELVSGAFLDVPFLESLDLSCNSLTTDSLHGDVFRGHYDVRSYEPLPLRILLLAQNNLSNGLLSLALEHTPDLRKIDLSYNHFKIFSESTMVALTSVKKLEVLDLSHTGISILPEKLMKSLTNLRELNLRGNNFFVIPQTIGITGRTLMRLDVSNNPASSIDEKSFMGLTELQKLNLNHMSKLTSITANAFANLTKLKVLRMTKCPQLQHIDNLAFIDPKLKNGVWTIEELHLESNNISSLPKLIEQWPPLKSLKLDDNPWNCKCSLALTVATHHKALENSLARCKTPYERAGILLKSIAQDFCINSRSVDDYEATAGTSTMIPQNTGNGKRRRSRPAVITAIVIFVLILAVLGATLGYAGSCLRERFRRRSTQPVKYTHIRNSIITNA